MTGLVSAPPVPDTLEQALSPAWLSAALGTRHPGIQITEVRPGPVVARITTNARFHICCEDGLPDGLGADLCLKGYFNEAGREARRAGLPEAYFYRDLAQACGVRTLRPYYADVDVPGEQAILIT